MNITENEVIARLRSLDGIDVTDDILQSTSYIPVADAYFNTLFNVDSFVLSGWSANKQTLAKAAEIAYVCMIVINDAPKELFKGALSEFKGFNPEEKKLALDRLKAECDRYLGRLGYSMEVFGGGVVGGGNYVNDTYNSKNIDFSDTEYDFDPWT